MRYIGNKVTLLDFIDLNILEPDKYDNFIDCFAGTGCVGEHFKNKYTIISCDLLNSSYIQFYCKVSLNKIPTFDNLGGIEKVIDTLNRLNGIESFIFNEYGENGKSNRLYFSEKNSKKIDSIIVYIEDTYNSKEINYDEYIYLKYLLIEACSKVSNITGVYGSYLKKLYSNSINPICIKPIDINHSDKEHSSLLGDTYDHIQEKTDKKTIIYLDPPYNSRQYGSNYHLLNTISLGKIPIIKKVKGADSVTGLPENLPLSNWCSKIKVYNELEKYLKLDYGQLMLSYNNEGIMTKTEIIELFNTYGTTKVVEKQYKKFKSNKNNNDNYVIEYLFISTK